jgi:hypothetical protein
MIPNFLYFCPMKGKVVEITPYLYVVATPKTELKYMQPFFLGSLNASTPGNIKFILFIAGSSS